LTELNEVEGRLSVPARHEEAEEEEEEEEEEEFKILIRYQSYIY